VSKNAYIQSKILHDVLIDKFGSVRVAKIALSKKNKGRCWLCGIYFMRIADITIDHVVPVSKGGGHNWSNLMPAHKVCNQQRGNGDS
jgi:5-methylcytosine-specific restriction endonuclease McrA